MQPLAKIVLNLGASERQKNRYRVVALLFRLGQAEEILALLSRFYFKETNWKKYNFNQLPTTGKQREGKIIVY